MDASYEKIVDNENCQALKHHSFETDVWDPTTYHEGKTFGQSSFVTCNGLNVAQIGMRLV